jgi:hypothetical protein
VTRRPISDATPGPLSHRAITGMVQSAQKAFNRAASRSSAGPRSARPSAGPCERPPGGASPGSGVMRGDVSGKLAVPRCAANPAFFGMGKGIGR